MWLFQHYISETVGEQAMSDDIHLKIQCCDADGNFQIQSSNDVGDRKIKFVGGDLAIESNDFSNSEIDSNKNINMYNFYIFVWLLNWS